MIQEGSQFRRRWFPHQGGQFPQQSGDMLIGVLFARMAGRPDHGHAGELGTYADFFKTPGAPGACRPAQDHCPTAAARGESVQGRIKSLHLPGTPDERAMAQDGAAGRAAARSELMPREILEGFERFMAR